MLQCMCWIIFWGVIIYTTTYHLGRYSLHLLILKSSKAKLMAAEVQVQIFSVQVCPSWRDVLYGQPEFWREVRPVLHCRDIRSWSSSANSPVSVTNSTTSGKTSKMLTLWPLKDNWHGSGSVSRAVASDTRGLRFNYYHRKILCVYSVNCIETTKIIKKLVGVVHLKRIIDISGPSYKRPLIVIYDYGVVLTENCLEYNSIVVNYDRRTFKRMTNKKTKCAN